MVFFHKTIFMEKINKKHIVQTCNLFDLSIQDLLFYEKAACSVCQKYENALRQYDGSIAKDDLEYNKFERINNIHHNILDEMENRLMGLK